MQLEIKQVWSNGKTVRKIKQFGLAGTRVIVWYTGRDGKSSKRTYEDGFKAWIARTGAKLETLCTD